jgi:hypothetical protein
LIATAGRSPGGMNLAMRVLDECRAAVDVGTK